MILQKDYKTYLAVELSNDVIWDVNGEIEINLDDVVDSDIWFLLFEPGNTNQESIFFHRRVWSTVYCYGVNRDQPVVHLENSQVLVVNSIDYMNYLLEQTNRQLYIYKKSLQHIVCVWWVFYINWKNIILSNLDTEEALTNKTLTSNATNYLYIFEEDFHITTTPITNEAYLIATLVVWVGWNIDILTKHKTFIVWNKWDAATIEIWTVEQWESPSVTNSWTVNDAVLDFVLQKWDKWDKTIIYSTITIPNNSIWVDWDWAFSTAVWSEVYYKSWWVWTLKNSNRWATWATWASITSWAFVWNNLVFTKDNGSTVTILDAKLDLKWDKGDKTIIHSTVWIPSNAIWVDWDWAFDTSSNSYVYYKSAWVWTLKNSNKWATGEDSTVPWPTWNWIQWTELLSTVWKVNTYRITFTNWSTFDYVVTDWLDWEWSWDMLKSENLSWLENIATARSNLWLWTAAQSDIADFASALWVDDNYVTDAEKTAIWTIWDKEVTANKSTNVTTDWTSDTKYPSVKAIKDYADWLVAWLLDYRWAYDASVNTFPTSWWSWTAWVVLKWDMWIISVTWTLWWTAVQIWDSLIASIDAPWQTAWNWNILNSNISYVPEDVVNKSTTLDTDKTSDTKYPSVKSVYDWVVGLFAQKWSITTSWLTQNTWKLLWRNTASAGAVEEITLWTNLSFDWTTLNASASGWITPIRITIPWELIADTWFSQWLYWYNDTWATITISNVAFTVSKAAAWSWASCAFNIYKSSWTAADWINTNAVALFTTAVDLTTNYISLTNTPNTTTVESGRYVSLRITASAWATNKANNAQIIITYS